MHPCLIQPENTKRKICPVNGLMPRLGDKWTIHVVAMLHEHKRLRFSELKNGIEGVSQKMLTVTLRALERDGLVDRHVFPEVPPRVEYELTELGRGLLPAMYSLMDWLQMTWPTIQEKRIYFDVKHK